MQIGPMETRLHIREVASDLDSTLAISEELDGILRNPAVKDVIWRNDGIRSVSDVALELVATAKLAMTFVRLD